MFRRIFRTRSNSSTAASDSPSKVATMSSEPMIVEAPAVDPSMEPMLVAEPVAVGVNAAPAVLTKPVVTSPLSTASFDPAVHLAYSAPTKRHTMEELGLGGQGISKIGVTDPFPLLSADGVRALRRDLFTKTVLDNYTVTSKISALQVRGMGSDGLANFITELWSHPDTIKACSEAAGMDLVPIMSYELGHTNVQTPNRTAIKETLGKLGPEPLPALVASTESDPSSEDEDEVEDVGEDGVTKAPRMPVVDWHHDSYPWVCVVMLSDASTMIGGETAIQCGDGSIKKVRGPGLGYAVMMQGRYINHAAMNAYYAPERVTMVTSFRARDADIKDESVLTTIRPISHPDGIYNEWTQYRVELLAERFKNRFEKIKSRKPNVPGPDGRLQMTPFDKEEFKKWAEEQIAYLKTTIDEIV